MNRDQPQDLDVALVCMPFGILTMPSIGLESIKSSLPPECRARTFYLTLDFAAEIGAELYREISGELQFERPLIGEWVWSAALHGDVGKDGETGEDGDIGEDDGFFAAPITISPGMPPASPERLSAVRDLRRLTDAFLDACVRRIEAHRPRLVGFTSTFQQHVASLALARRLKARRSEIFIVVGGANCEGKMGLATVRRFPFVDAVVSGEGEAIFPRLVERVLGGREVDDLEGVYTRRNHERLRAALGQAPPPNAPRVADLDTLPRPDYSPFFRALDEADLGLDEWPHIPFETSRGCWWGEASHCTFCGLNGLSMAFRSKSAERALEELQALAGAFPGKPVMVVDNILDMRYFRDFLPALAEADLGVELFYEVKANLRKDQLKLLRAAGVRSILPGIESFSDDILERMGKGVRGLQNVQLLKWCAELGLRPRWYLIWGFPGENAEDYEQMARWVPWLTHLPPPSAATRIQLHRFSPNFERAEDLGFTEVEPVPGYAHVYRDSTAALADLAYHFRFSYQDGRDVEAYTARLAREVDEWQRVFAGCDLVYTDHGEELWVWDLRPSAARPVTHIEGLARELYLACDQVRTLSWLARRMAGDDARAVEDALGPLVEDGLMLRDGERVLSLALEGKAAAGTR